MVHDPGSLLRNRDTSRVAVLAYELRHDHLTRVRPLRLSPSSCGSFGDLVMLFVLATASLGRRVKGQHAYVT